MASYVHGYSAEEGLRLKDQATTLARLLYEELQYPKGTTVLEAGCGTGCQTVFLAAAHPHTHFVSMDISAASLHTAAEAIAVQGLTNVSLQQGDIFEPPFAEQQFDHIFVCFVLEHLADPVGALTALRQLLKSGGTITVIEGDHGSFYCHPETAMARRTVDCLVQLQAGLGGDGLIGRRLYPLLTQAGFAQPRVEPRMVYVDGSQSDLIEGFSRNTFIAMVRGVREQAIDQGLIDAAAWDQGISDLERAAEPEGIFCYTFFRAWAKR
ncbi:methyltransferase domain-containing protein [uncultured Desulfobulbus sp.]|uniref:methyltransferase domain-containing protein n=1 Tax=uncultured Desulfobulbus sp. TaxID=239745 RepID=UPI0029C8BAD3|nr:methyltransferase domain-containing protein [uncultured Desulfobulbus sp.]